MKYSIEQINKELEPIQWKCVSQKYENLDSELEFICNENHHVFSTWKKIRVKAQCPVCKSNIYKNSIACAQPTQKRKGNYRILALDQATKISGYSIYENGNLIKYGIFETQLEDVIARDNAVKNWLISMIKNWQPDLIGIEGIQYQANMGVTTFQSLAWLQGILMECCFELGIKYELVNTNTWRHKTGVKGQTRADRKRSIQLLVKQWYDITVTEDEADSIGIGRYLSQTYKPTYKAISWE